MQQRLLPSPRHLQAMLSHCRVGKKTATANALRQLPQLVRSCQPDTTALLSAAAAATAAPGAANAGTERGRSGDGAAVRGRGRPRRPRPSRRESVLRGLGLLRGFEAYPLPGPSAPGGCAPRRPRGRAVAWTPLQRGERRGNADERPSAGAARAAASPRFLGGLPITGNCVIVSTAHLVLPAFAGCPLGLWDSEAVISFKHSKRPQAPHSVPLFDMKGVASHPAGMPRTRMSWADHLDDPRDCTAKYTVAHADLLFVDARL